MEEQQQPLSPENVTALIDHLLKTRDPATVGLRRILKRKSDEGRAFPLRELSLESFPDESGAQTVFSEAEKESLALQKQCAELSNRLAEQKQKAAQAIQNAYKKGVDDGYARGEREGRTTAAGEYDQKLEAVHQRFADMFAAVESCKQEMLIEHQELILAMAQSIAGKIINTELSMNKDIVCAVVKKALSFIADRERLIVRVAPEDLETLTGKRDFWLSVGERLENVRIESDERIDTGGCIIESASGAADARIAVQIDEMHEVIERVWRDTARGSPGPEEDAS